MSGQHIILRYCEVHHGCLLLYRNKAEIVVLLHLILHWKWPFQPSSHWIRDFWCHLCILYISNLDINHLHYISRFLESIYTPSFPPTGTPTLKLSLSDTRTASPSAVPHIPILLLSIMGNRILHVMEPYWFTLITGSLSFISLFFPGLWGSALADMEEIKKFICGEYLRGAQGPKPRDNLM